MERVEKSVLGKTHICPDCGALFSKLYNYRQHLKKRQTVSCDHCPRRFCSNDEYQKHLRSIKTTRLDKRIYHSTGYENDTGYQNLITQKINEIKDWEKKHIINKQINSDFTYKQLNDLLLDIYKHRKNAFKLNMGIRFILYITITQEYKYHYVSTNNLLFEKALMINNISDVTHLMDHIMSLDLETDFYLKKPSSQWVIAGLTNIQFLVFDLRDQLLG